MILVYSKYYSTGLSYNDIAAEIANMFDDAVNNKGLSVDYTVYESHHNLKIDNFGGHNISIGFYYRDIHLDGTQVSGFYAPNDRTLVKAVFSENFVGFALFPKYNLFGWKLDDRIIGSFYMVKDDSNNIWMFPTGTLIRGVGSIYGVANMITPLVVRDITGNKALRTFYIYTKAGKFFEYNFEKDGQKYYQIHYNCERYAAFIENFPYFVFDKWDEEPTVVNL